MFFSRVALTSLLAYYNISPSAVITGLSTLHTIKRSIQDKDQKAKRSILNNIGLQYHAMLFRMLLGYTGTRRFLYSILRWCFYNKFPPSNSKFGDSESFFFSCFTLINELLGYFVV